MWYIVKALIKITHLFASCCRRKNLNFVNGICRMIVKDHTRWQVSGWCSDIGCNNLVSCRIIQGMEEENMGCFTWIILDIPGVKHEKWRPIVLLPWQKCLKGFHQNISRVYRFVYMHWVAPGDGERPVVMPVVAYRLLQETWTVDFCSLHQMVYGFWTIEKGEDRVYGINVVEG